MTLPVVLIHGGGFDRRCWDLVLPHLDGEALAVDLPGRGSRPLPLQAVDFAACAASVAADVEAAGFDEVVLAGHSLAGCSMPAIIGRLEGRVRHALFIACTVPEHGSSAFDTLDPEIQQMIQGREATGAVEPRPMDGGIARLVLGNDLTEEQIAWCLERLVAEAPPLTTQPVDLSPLRNVPSTWLRTLQDLIVNPDKQLRFARNVGEGCEVVDMDAGHMCMVSQPVATAEVLNQLAAR